MSDTPRTDAEALWPACDDSPDKPSEGGGYVYSDFARQLERELSQAKAELAAVRADAERLNWLEELTKRLATWQGASGVVEKWLETDICIRGPNVNIYIRDEHGQHIRGGTGSCVRLAIDSAREQQTDNGGKCGQ